ncbi:beta-lactamase family protein [Streptomyces sp. NA04227]|nr:beta-lactamase family protein [Streptomyces sp. NA04227]
MSEDLSPGAGLPPHTDLLLGTDLPLDERLARALPHIDAPQAVIAVSSGGVVTEAVREPEECSVSSGGAVTEVTREPGARRYELGSATKTFTVLLLAELARSGVLRLDDPLAAHLPSLRLPYPEQRRITLRHLATHTAGLPRLPPDLTRSALLHPGTNPYPRYDTRLLLDAFARIRPRHRPGTRWHYSNLGVALLGPALAHATGTCYPDLLAERVLTPMGLCDTGLGASAADVTGHRALRPAPLPATDMGAFAAAGGLRATSADVLAYLVAHLRPQDHHRSPAQAPLAAALADVQVPQLRRGARRQHTHTLTWFQHPAPGGELLFHCGATFGQQVFLGFHRASGTALFAACTRRGNRRGLVATGYRVLWELASSSASAPSPAASTSARCRARTPAS